MPLKNYSSESKLPNIFSAIDKSLVSHGAKQINKEYDSEGKIISDTRVYAPNTTAVNYISWNVNTSNAFLNHYYDASFVKLREITLTYNFSSALLSKTFLEKASISFVGRNLFLWSDMKEVDPDPGSDNLQTPSTRSIGFNLDFTF